MLPVPLPLLNLGDINGVIYDFAKAGDILPKHVHSEDNVHITIVARGKIKAYSHDWEVIGLPGQILDMNAWEPHELLALEDNTRVINIVKKHNGNIINIPYDESTIAALRAKAVINCAPPRDLNNEPLSNSLQQD